MEHGPSVAGDAAEGAGRPPTGSGLPIPDGSGRQL